MVQEGEGASAPSYDPISKGKEPEDGKKKGKKGKKGKKDDKEPPPPVVPFFSMFRYATGFDKFLMTIGSIGAAANGASMWFSPLSPLFLPPCSPLL